MAKKPDKREVCEKLFAHRIKQRQGLQRKMGCGQRGKGGDCALCNRT